MWKAMMTLIDCWARYTVRWFGIARTMGLLAEYPLYNVFFLRAGSYVYPHLNSGLGVLMKFFTSVKVNNYEVVPSIKTGPIFKWYLW